MSGHAHDMKKEIQKYRFIGISLLVLTVVTVLAQHLHVEFALAVTIALLIATFKGSLVVSFFMHLIAERKLIYLILILTVFFFISMMGLIVAGNFSLPEGTRHLEKEVVASSGTGEHGSPEPAGHEARQANEAAH